MPIQLFIGFTVEGTTDTRFLKEIIQTVFEETAYECSTDVEIEDVRIVDVPKTTFVETMLEASRKAAIDYGMSVLCIHADSDARTIEDVTNNKFNPLVEALNEVDNENYCKSIVPIIPIQMTEAWMLADKELLKEKIGAKNKQNIDLGIEKSPESYADPKETIKDAIRIAQAEKVKRKRNELTINDLYEELGQSISLNDLREIPSFCVFEGSVKSAFRSLGYIQ